jgi:hypothetical protein
MCVKTIELLFADASLVLGVCLAEELLSHLHACLP